VSDNLTAFSRNKIASKGIWAICLHISYLQNDIDQEESYQLMKQRLDAIDLSFGERANRLFYLSIAPSFIETISNNIKLDLAAHRIRIVLLSKNLLVTIKNLQSY
jgi:glucose-6-phosphate 1-dehydrogenase